MKIFETKIEKFDQKTKSNVFLKYYKKIMKMNLKIRFYYL